MQKLFSNILGAPVYEDDSLRAFNTVKDIIIDPERGDMLGIVVEIRRNMIIAPIDIVSWGDSVRVDHRDVVTEGNEILRVEEVLKREIHIPHSKVVSEDGDSLGVVFDYSIDSNSWKLNKIFVHKVFLGLIRFETRIIPAKEIVEISKGKIVVKNNLNTIKATEGKKVSAQDVAVS
ncbi:hypothetical protein HN709_02255 [Candidatus Peregrinibacteria bacterium]|jgi:uncharacterized protein YrrD|nr:hypothetical protein [Candidatus Peregrinibacteria bacterium]MBT7736485.1 hypothetical protein [Candidatus Peregrinibacteria bacterium]